MLVEKTRKPERLLKDPLDLNRPRRACWSPTAS